MAEQSEKFLNLLVVASTAIVLLLVFDQVGTMLNPFIALIEPDSTTVSVSELSQKCSNLWKGHRENATRAHGDEVNKWHSDHHAKPKYSSSHPAFCQRLPADLSAPHLWNEHLDWVLDASSDEQDISSHLITSKLLQFLTPSQYLELGHRTRPANKPWGRLLAKIEKRLTLLEAPIVHVAAFGAGNCDWDAFDDDEQEENKDDDCMWTVRLETFLNAILNHGIEEGNKRAIIKITPMYSPPELDVTTEFDTAVMKHNLWSDYIYETGGPDVIITAFNGQDMFRPNRDTNTAKDYDFYHHQREIIQDFFRTCLQYRPCGTNEAKDPPLLISVDDYVGNKHGPVMAENVQARVLQQLSDYYETVFVSYAEVIRKLVYASSDNRSPLTHNSFKDWMSLTAATSHTNKPATMEHLFLGPIAMTLTLAYSFLRYTVSYCEEQSSTQDYALVEQEVFSLVDDVIPPILNKDLCLNNVTELWREEKSKQEKAPPCNGNNCAFAFWGGTQDTKDMLDEYLHKFVHDGDMEGWQTRHDGRLMATEGGATMRLQMKAVESLPGNWTIKLFSVYKDAEDLDSTHGLLQWELSPKRRRNRRMLEHHPHNNYTKVQPRRALQDSTATGFIEGTHDSPSTVVLPTIINVDPSLLASPLELTLHLDEGDYFEIVAIMFCADPN